MQCVNFLLLSTAGTLILMAGLQPSLEYVSEVWNTKECHTKALQSIQLRACKYILGCSVTSSDEPVCADFDLKTLRYTEVFRKLKCYCKVMSTNHERVRF